MVALFSAKMLEKSATIPGKSHDLIFSSKKIHF
jgi:hypothetical protein